MLHAHLMEQTRPKEHAVQTASRVLPDGRIVELVYEPDAKRTVLAVADGKQTEFVDRLDVGEGEHLVPIPASNNLIRHEAIMLPGRPQSYGDVGQLVGDIQQYFDRYVSLSDWFRTLAAYYVLFTWVYDAFQEVPYIRLQAEWGSGKTRALITIGSLTCRGFFASGASTVSPIFHTLDTFRGTLILDEADFRFSDQTAELTKILNNGNVQGFPVFRTTMTLKREFDPRAFHVFGTKLVAMRKSFNDEALESRFITERLDHVNMRPDIPLNLPPTQRAEALSLRNKLLQYRFDHRLKLRADETLVDPSLSARTNQILVPLLSIVPDVNARTEMRVALRMLEHDRVASRSTSTTAELLEVLVEAHVAQAGGPVPVADITARFIERCGMDYERPITNRYIGSILRSRLGLNTYKHHGTYAVAVDANCLAQLSARYGIARQEKEVS